MSGLPFMSVSSFSVHHLAPRRRVAPRLRLLISAPKEPYSPPREGVHNLPPRRAASALCRAVQHCRRRRDVAPDVCSVALCPSGSASAASRLSSVIM
eukprot:1376472-Pleurochrysis_carterae.AAC.1